MSAAYDPGYTPPAPVAEFSLAVPGGAFGSGPHRGLIDTGADICLVPFALVESLDLVLESQRVLRGYDGSRRSVDVYVVDIEIAGARLPALEIVADDAVDEPILGRNVLNRLRLLLDGPRAVIELRP